MTETLLYSLFIFFATGISLIYLISGLDDLFIDGLAWIKGLRPQLLDEKQLKVISDKSEKLIAIIVPAWDESDVIGKMLVGNLRRIKYSNYHFFVGVYPNDPASITEVEKVNKVYPNVHAVINPSPGPSSKGQILNEVINQIMLYELEHNVHFDAVHMQDAEDLIHPWALKLVSHELDTYDFIQIPVFSLETKMNQIVAGIYMDEFAESHTKDILVRNYLGAAVPSAGVGTTLSRKLIQRFKEAGVPLFNEHSVTEDYELGINAKRLGLSPKFSCHYFMDGGRREYIATREYFPKHFYRSVRQKARWTVGNAIQGLLNLGWHGPIFNRYFLYRDRKGLLTNLVVLVGYMMMLLFVTLDSSMRDQLLQNNFLIILGLINLFFMFNRFIQRSICTFRIYGANATLMVVIRWPVGIIINAWAVLLAFKRQYDSMIAKKRIAWDKTQHELPSDFGTSVAS